MLVELTRDWFAPDAGHYFVRDNPHNFPDDWEDKIPSSAKKLEEKPLVKKT